MKVVLAGENQDALRSTLLGARNASEFTWIKLQIAHRSVFRQSLRATVGHNASFGPCMCGGATSLRRSWKSAALRFSTCEATRLRMGWRTGRQREWRSSQARPTQSKRSMVWLGRSECASLRQTWRRSLASPSVSSCRGGTPVHRKTRQQKRNELQKTPSICGARNQKTVEHT